MDITKTIFDRLEHHRFLKYDEDQKVWRTLHPLAVRDKIGHALRFSNRKGQGTASASRRKIRRSPSASSQSTFDSCESGMSSSYRSACASPLPNRSVSTNLTPSGDYYEMVQLAAQMDIRGIDVGVGKDNNNMAYSYGGQHPRLPSMVMIPPKQSESVLDFRPFEEDPEDEDLSWILKIPLLEVNENNEIFFVKQS